MRGAAFTQAPDPTSAVGVSFLDIDL